MSKSEEHIPDGEDEWTAHLDSITFSTTFETDEDRSRKEIEAMATDQLIEAIESGDVTPRWNVTKRNAEQRRKHAAMDDALRCDRCQEPTRGKMYEIVSGDGISVVCEPCRGDLKDICNGCGRTRSDLQPDEEMHVNINDGVTEYLCTECHATP